MFKLICFDPNSKIYNIIKGSIFKKTIFVVEEDQKNLNLLKQTWVLSPNTKLYQRREEKLLSKKSKLIDQIYTFLLYQNKKIHKTLKLCLKRNRKED